MPRTTASDGRYRMNTVCSSSTRYALAAVVAMAELCLGPIPYPPRGHAGANARPHIVIAAIRHAVPALVPPDAQAPSSIAPRFGPRLDRGNAHSLS